MSENQVQLKTDSGKEYYPLTQKILSFISFDFSSISILSIFYAAQLNQSLLFILSIIFNILCSVPSII